MRYFKNQLLSKKGVFIMKKNMFFFVSHYQKAKTMKKHIDIPNEILLENLESDEMYMYQIFWR